MLRKKSPSSGNSSRAMVVAVAEQVTTPAATASSSAPMAVFDDAGPMIASTPRSTRSSIAWDAADRTLPLVGGDQPDVVAQCPTGLVHGVDGGLDRRLQGFADPRFACGQERTDREDAVVDALLVHLGGRRDDRRRRVGAPVSAACRSQRNTGDHDDRQAEPELFASSPHESNSTVNGARESGRAVGVRSGPTPQATPIRPDTPMAGLFGAARSRHIRHERHPKPSERSPTRRCGVHRARRCVAGVDGAS